MSCLTLRLGRNRPQMHSSDDFVAPFLYFQGVYKSALSSSVLSSPDNLQFLHQLFGEEIATESYRQRKDAQVVSDENVTSSVVTG
ncbi:hypothetical protein AVEN_128808-1 [Araneus ventricosus]|uniref:Uncharacterized protein n=1 Tax=Araneus ventricosus TaxID=182803 RepID=A0A4Y2K6T2_ARAVE|nr:hypothetical protein AVEN_128808-1 [Araneus ventricosus]